MQGKTPIRRLALVREPYDRRGAVAWAIIAGFTLALAYSFIGYELKKLALLLFALPLIVQAAIYYVLQFGVLGLALLAGLRLLNRIRRPGFVYIIGHIFGSSYLLGLHWFSLMTSPGLVADDPWLILYEAVIVAGCVVLGAMAGLGLLLLNLLLRNLQGDIIEQDGTHCWQCGYMIGNPQNPPTSTTCQECGQENSYQGPQPNEFLLWFYKFRKRRWKAALVVFLALVFLPLAFKAKTDTDASTILGVSGRQVRAGIFLMGTRNGSLTVINFADGFGTIMKLEDSPQMELGVMTTSSPSPGQPHMQLQLMSASSPGGWGDPVVLCDLDASQAEWIRTHGIPKKLIEAIVETAHANNWQPNLPSAPYFGGFVTIQPDQYLPNVAEVDQSDSSADK